jgi:Protein of unknown function, DUF547
MKIIIFVIFSIISVATEAFDHSYQSYDQVLRKYVSNGLVDYAGLLRNRRSIDAVIGQLKSVKAPEYNGWNRKEQLAFWINAYNAWFLQIVINHYPIKKTRLLGFIYPDNSVQQIPGIWKEIKLDTAGTKVSLDEMEHKILRPVFKEPRIHFAIVCASVGCPQLQNEAYTPSKLEQQLEDSARRFINNASKVRLRRTQKQLQVSKIFKWFADDFARFGRPEWRKWYSGAEAGVVGFISRYLPPDDVKFLHDNAVSLDYLEYDWSLNEKR